MDKAPHRPPNLETVVALRTWPTPRSQDSKHGRATEWELAQPKSYDLLHTAVARRDKGREISSWPTPTSIGQNRAGTMQEWGGSQNWVRTADPELARGALNPEWVELLMGFPPGWTEV